MTADITVYIRGGTYNLTETLAFDQRDSGTNGFNVIYKAYPGERPLISGGRQIAGWTPVANGIYRASVGPLDFRQLYVDGRRATRARTPNKGSYYRILRGDGDAYRIVVNSNETTRWPRLNDVEMHIQKEWTGDILRIASFTVSGRESYVTPREPERTRSFNVIGPFFQADLPYHFENNYQFLDEPGEWYLNNTTDELFYKPRPGESISTAETVVPAVETLVRLAGTVMTPVHHVQFYGLTFAHSNWAAPSDQGFVGVQAGYEAAGPTPAAIRIEAANNLRFERNIFTHLGASGVAMVYGAQDNVFIGNVFDDISISGLIDDWTLEENPSDARRVSRRNVIRNNFIRKVSQDYYGGVGILLGYTDSAGVEHNEIADLPYTGISLGWGWSYTATEAGRNLIRYNHIHDVMSLLSDGAGIYTLSNQPGTHIVDNYIHDLTPSVWNQGYPIAGVYLDEGTSFITVANNVFSNVPENIFINMTAEHPPRSITLTNNDGASSAVIANAGIEEAYRDILRTPASAPRQLSATVNLSNVVLRWQAPDGEQPVVGYVLEVGFASGRTDVNANVGNGLQFSATAASGTYYVRVRAYNEAGLGPPSTELIVVVGQPFPPPGAPSTLASTLGPNRTVTLTWTASSGIVSHYVIEVGTSAGSSNLGSFPVGSTAVIVTNVPPGSYFIRVRAANAAGPSPPSNEILLVVQ